MIKISKCDTCSNNTQELSAECYDCVKGIEDNYDPINKEEDMKSKCKDIKEEFVEFCKDNGLETEFVDSDKPDTFETFFGDIHMTNQKEL